MADQRLFRILYTLLEGGASTAPELAEMCEVSVRTIYRDIDALSAAGIPIYSEPGRGGGVRLLPGFSVGHASFSEEERREILSALDGLSATGLQPDAETTTKLAALFRISEPRWLEVDFSRWGNHPGDADLIPLLRDAIINHEVIEIRYAASDGAITQREIEPILLSYKSRAWYLKAYCRLRSDFRIFKLTRITTMQRTKEIFEAKPWPEETELPSLVEKNVVLRFSHDAAYRVLDEFEPSEIERIRDDDGFLVRTQLPIDEWLVGYVLSFGGAAELLEPTWLRKTIRDRAAAVDALHKP